MQLFWHTVSVCVVCSAVFMYVLVGVEYAVCMCWAVSDMCTSANAGQTWVSCTSHTDKIAMSCCRIVRHLLTSLTDSCPVSNNIHFTCSLTTLCAWLMEWRVTRLLVRQLTAVDWNDLLDFICSVTMSAVHMSHGQWSRQWTYSDQCNKVHLNYVKYIIVYTHVTLALYRLD